MASLSIGTWSFDLPDWLAQRLIASHANPAETTTFPEVVNKEVQTQWDVEDASLQIRPLRSGGVELRSPRVFLDPPAVVAAPGGQPALTYFVNELRAGEKAVPYSMVTATDVTAAGFASTPLGDGEIVVNQWLADDLGLARGIRLTLKYFVMGERRQLTEVAREFTVAAVLPMDTPQLDPSWTPDFPGLTDKKNCRDWQPGFQMDTGRIRDRDEAYWLRYRGTPKAFVNLKIGQEMWGNRWGNVTSIRYPRTVTASALSVKLRDSLTPESVGLSILPLREQALAATKAPVDFGELFVSFSFFLIAAAAVLTGMLFVFSLEQRNAEAGLLLALGLRPRQVRRLFLAEGVVLALVGSVFGAAGAIVYTRLVLFALAGVWRGAVGAVEFTYAANPATLPIGVVSGVGVALLAMWLASRRQLRRSARELLTGEVSGDSAGGRRVGTRVPAIIAVTSLILAVALPFAVKGPGAFFGAGALLLIAGLALALRSLRSLATGIGLASVAQLGVRNAARRRGRSLATIAVLASGVFMVVAVDSFRHQPLKDGDTSDPGTGGFALVGESALPIYEDLNSPKGREAYGLDAKLLDGATVVPLRVRDGDDASCLNLNRAIQPRLLGVKPEELAGRFGFAPKEPGWSLLAVNQSADEVPGIVDANTLQWSMQKSIGDTIEYRDDRGQTFRVRIVATVTGSILQGNVLIAEDAFVQHFPNAGGYRLFLIACAPEKTSAIRGHLRRQLSDRGLEIVTTSERLGEFQAVENTYLSIFQALGGLGLLLGSAGLAIVVARNVLERRREFGLLSAVGFRARQLRQLVFAEHRRLIVAALLIGTFSALLAVWPNLAGKGGGFPFREIAVLLVALALGCLFWTWLATRLALRGSGVSALRSE
jgi:ABC-type lipoprotein release transport system permease subunit